MLFFKDKLTKRSVRDTGWSRCSWTSSATSSNSTMGSTASTSYVHQKFNSSSSTMGSSASTTYVHQKLIRHMFIYLFSKIKQFKMVQRRSWCSRQPRQAQLWRVKRVPVMFIQNLHDNCLYAIFQRQIDKMVQASTGWSRCSWTPSAISSNSTLGSTASTSYVQQKLTLHMLISFNSKTNPFKVDPRGIKMLLYTPSNLVKLNHSEYSKYQWSRCSRKPSSTSSSSTMGSSVSTTFVHQKLIWRMLIYYFSKINRFKMVPRRSWCFWGAQQVPLMSIKNW